MSSLSSLPEEIQVDIFIRLPVNSVLACRCVCKIWLNLLCNPRFIKNHLNLTIQCQNYKNPRLMFGRSQYDKGKNPIINSIDYKSISSSSNLKVVSMNYPFQNKKIKASVTLGCCNGLICLGISSGGMGIHEKNYICIWNPATGEYRNIKRPRCDFLTESEYYVRYGFGYASNVDDYKLVRILDNDGFFNKIQVYMLGSSCWKTIRCKDRYRFPHQLHKRFPGVLINGVLHWSGAMTTTEGTFSKVIVCFDINNQRLLDVPFPEEILPPLQDRKVYREVGVLGDCLSVVFSVIDIQTDIWVMRDYGVRESWTKVFSIPGYQIFKPIWSFENGDILVYARKQLSLCNQNNGKTRKVLLVGIIMSRYPESYVESLVSLNSGTYVEKKTTNGIEKKPRRQRLR